MLWPSWLHVTVEVEVCIVPHFKAPVYCKVEPRGPEHGGIFILQNTRSKIGQLLHKSGHFDSDMHTTAPWWDLTSFCSVAKFDMKNLTS